MGAVTQPVKSVTQELAKPATKVLQAAGVVEKERPRIAQQMAEAATGQGPAPSAIKSAAAERKEEVVSTLRARRRGARALLSESRLNPETGLGTTLGSGPMV